MGLERVKFKGYTVAQIETIMKARLADLEAFHDDAVEMCAKKVAQYWGDMRRALQIARRAAEICDREGRHRQRQLQMKMKEQTMLNRMSQKKKRRRRRNQVDNEMEDSDFESDSGEDKMDLSSLIREKSYVSISHIMKAAKELDSTPSILAIKHTADYEAYFWQLW